MALHRLPVRQCLVRLRYCRIHDLAVLTGAGGQFDDIAVGIAEIDRCSNISLGERKDSPLLVVQSNCRRPRTISLSGFCCPVLGSSWRKIRSIRSAGLRFAFLSIQT
jgi:hypothetical protein